MSSLTITKPDATDYAAYYGKYVALVPDEDIRLVLERQLDETLALIGGIPESKGESRYAPGKWSIKEVVGHVTDAERIFSYRALRFARGDDTPLPGFEQDDYVRSATFDAFPLKDLLTEYEHVRHSTLFMFRHLSAEAWERKGVASENEISVRALAYIIAGHELHHRAILRARYL